MKSKAYRAIAVKEVRLADVVSKLAAGTVWVGLDVGKERTMVVLRDSEGTMLRPWRVRQPGEIRLLVERLGELAQQRSLVVALEPTGTYGDPLRQALGDAGLVVQRVSPKAASDYAEVFDGVPSQHDGKDAAVVAELASIGKSEPWPLVRTEADQLRHAVHWLDTQQDILQLWLGRLEALLARHWPELTTFLELTSVTLLRLLEKYGGPEGLRQDPEAAVQLARWSRSKLTSEKIAQVLASAQSTVGVRMAAADVDFVQRCAREALNTQREIDRVRSSLEKQAAQHPGVERVGQVVGLVTACVLAVTVGDPRNYSCGPAYRKALGLNLKERSSGKHQGQLKITKRGPSLARRWLYFAALRRVQDPAVRPWYESKKRRCQDRGGKAVVGVMRKLALAIYAVAQGATFDPARLFPGRNVAADGSWLPQSPGALPPDPRNLPLSGHSGGEGNETTGASASTPAACSAAAAGRRSGRFPPEPYPPSR